MSPFDSRYLPQRPRRISNTSPRGEEEREEVHARDVAYAPKSAAEERPVVL